MDTYATGAVAMNADHMENPTIECLRIAFENQVPTGVDLIQIDMFGNPWLSLDVDNRWPSEGDESIVSH